MAKLSADGTYVTVESGDSLSEIAQDYGGGTSQTQAIANYNNISNINFISVGQKIYLPGKTASTTSPPSTDIDTKTYSNKVTIKKFGLQSNADNTLFVSWSWAKHDQTEKYRIKWMCLTKDGTYFNTINDLTADHDDPSPYLIDTYQIPAYAVQVSVSVLPVSREISITGNANVSSATLDIEGLTDDAGYAINVIKVTTTTPNTSSSTTKSITSNTDESVKYIYWLANWSYVSDDLKFIVGKQLPPKAPSSPPTVTIEGNTLTAEYKDIDWVDLGLNKNDDNSYILFRVIRDDVAVSNDGVVLILNLSDSQYANMKYQCAVDDGHRYKVQCRSHRDGLQSAWTETSDNYNTKPAKPSSPICYQVDEGSSIHAEWSSVDTAKTYKLQYTTDQDYFYESPDKVQNTGDTPNTTITFDVDPGKTYYVRLQAITSDGKESEWSEPVAVIVGTTASPPTIWSSTSKVEVGEELVLYWAHNCEDGSPQEHAILRLQFGDHDDPEVKEYNIEGAGRFLLEFLRDSEGKYEGKLSTIESYETDENRYNNCSCTIITKDNDLFKEGVKLIWCVRTAGINGTPGEVSASKQVDVFAKPSVFMSLYKVSSDVETPVVDRVDSLPIRVRATTDPTSQKPIGFHVSVISNSLYETVDNVGKNKVVSAGEAVYSRYYDGYNPFPIDISAGDIDLEPGQNYTITCTASMDSGLTAEASASFVVNWEDVAYVPNAEVAVDMSNYVAYVKPYCAEEERVYYNVTEDELHKTDKVYDPVKMDNVYTGSGETVLLGMERETKNRMYYCASYYDKDGNLTNKTFYKVNYNATDGSYVTDYDAVVSLKSITRMRTSENDEILLGSYEGIKTYYCIRNERRDLADVLLSVYRREYDGAFTKIASGIDSGQNVFVTDPHPSLDYARYRIVATHKTTGAVSYYDAPGYPIGAPYIIIQWDEEWSAFDTNSSSIGDRPVWSGSWVRLPFNVDVSSSNRKDVSLVEYAGRSHPVAYHGTHLGESATWNTVVQKEDVDTLYALRRLSRWMGTVYVREPSGVGYRAILSLTMPQKHADPLVAITFDITRVDGDDYDPAEVVKRGELPNG